MPDNGNGTQKITKKGMGRKVWAWYQESLEDSGEFRKEALTDCAYYDGNQWTQEEKKILKDRGQPALVINRIKPTVEVVEGTERKARVECVAVPRNETAVMDAAIATDSLKFVRDQNQGEYVCSEAFSQQIRAGWGVIEVYENDDPFSEVVGNRIVNRNDIFWDKYAKKYDNSDAKFILRVKWLELEDAVAKFPRHKVQLEAAVSSEEEEKFKDQPYHGTEDKSDRPGVTLWDTTTVANTEWIDRSRRRVKLIECWYKVPTETWFVENDLTGDVDELDPSQMAGLISTPGVRFTKRMIQKVRLCITAGDNVLEDGPSPYRHNNYPFVFFWGYLTDKERHPYGVIRQARDPQDEVNKRRSKKMHLLNTRQILATTDAIDQSQNDWRKVKQEATKPDGTILLNPKIKEGRFEFVNQIEIINAQDRAEQEAKAEIEEITGVVAELRGLETNASSGKAIIARQIQGNTMLATLFDNYRRSRLVLEQLNWAMIQQYWTKPKVIRITDKTGGIKFVELNKYLMDGSQVLIQNDISKAKVDIVIDEQVFHATMRQALMEQMMEMISKLPPDIGLLLLDIVLSYSDLPKVQEMIQRIQQVQGIAQKRQDQEDQLKAADAQIKMAKSAEGGPLPLGGSQNSAMVDQGANPVNSPQAIEQMMMGGLQ